MAEYVEVYLPKLGESIMHATIIQWLKKEGEEVSRDEPLLEVSTDKVNSEIPSPTFGIVKTIEVQEGEEVAVGDRLAIIVATSSSGPHPTQEESQKEKHLDPLPSHNGVKEPRHGDELFLSPVVKKLVETSRISMEELQEIPTTGKRGRLSKKDLDTYLQQKGRQPPYPSSEEQEIEEKPMSNLRKVSATKMVQSMRQAPQATLIHEVDVTHIVKALQKYKNLFFDTHGYKISITSFIAKALVQSVQHYPLVNSSLVEETILIKHFINLGIAVHVDQEVIVPVIHQCHHCSLREIAQKISHLAHKTRTHQLHPSDVQGGTMTITNFGASGILTGTPILPLEEVAIIGVGAIQKRIIVTSKEQLAIRSMIYISLTFDHRVFDGMYGCHFLKEVKTSLEEMLPDHLLKEALT